MKEIKPLALMLVAILLTACAASEPKNALLSPPPIAHNDSDNGAARLQIQTIEFSPGVSSATVERLARQYGCNGGNGAGLITDKGPVEVYRMVCDNGKTFLARCELRQCQTIR